MPYLLRILLTPGLWTRNCPTDWEWDRALNALLDAGAPVEAKDECIAMLGSARVWIANWPYAFGSLQGPPPSVRDLSGLPSRRTALRLHDALRAQLADKRRHADALRREAFDRLVNEALAQEEPR